MKSSIANRHTTRGKPRNSSDPRFYSIEVRVRNNGCENMVLEHYLQYNPNGTNLVPPETMTFFKKGTMKVSFAEFKEVNEMGKWETLFHDKEREERIGCFRANRGTWIDEDQAHYEQLDQSGHLPRTKYYGYPYIYDQLTLDATAKNEEMALGLITNRGASIKETFRPYAPK